MKKIKIYSNLSVKSKWKGIVDYKVGGFVIGYMCILYQILSAFDVSAVYIVYVAVISLIPLFGIYTVLNKEDNVTSMLYNIMIYLFKCKNYTYYYTNYDYPNLKKN